MKPSRWLNVLRRITTAGPYVDRGLSMVVLTFVVVAGISAVGYADKSISSLSLAPLYFLPLALSALIHPFELALRFRLPVSVCTTFSAQFVMLGVCPRFKI
jgi:hypothetical protein